MHQRVSRCGWLAVAILGSIAACDCFGMTPSPEYLDVTVRQISYEGNNQYRVELTVYNRSRSAIEVKERQIAFYGQAETLGRWQELSASEAGGREGMALLPSGEAPIVYRVNIPVDVLPTLYTNGEGDINIMCRYLIRYTLRGSAGLQSNAGESSYWITPKTSNWILREGM